MSFFKSKADMYEGRAKRFKADGDRHWAKAMNGEGNFNFGKAKKKYSEASRNQKLAEEARKKK